MGSVLRGGGVAARREGGPGTAIVVFPVHFGEGQVEGAGHGGVAVVDGPGAARHSSRGPRSPACNGRVITPTDGRHSTLRAFSHSIDDKLTMPLIQVTMLETLGEHIRQTVSNFRPVHA
jgi:hypothetical protein